MDERFVEVEDQSFPTTVLRHLGRNHCVFLGHGRLSKTPSSRKLSNLLLRKRQLSLHKHLWCLRGDLTLATPALTRLLLGMLLLCISVSILNDYLIVCLASCACFLGRAGRFANSHLLMLV